MFKTAGAGAFFKAWQALRRDGEIPHYRTLFDRLAPGHVARLMLLEESGEQFIVRFMGTTYLELWSEEVTGRDALSIMPPGQRDGARRNLQNVLDMPCGSRLVGCYATGHGHEVEIEDVFLPAAWDPLESTCRHASLSIL